MLGGKHGVRVHGWMQSTVENGHLILPFFDSFYLSPVPTRT